MTDHRLLNLIKNRARLGMKIAKLVPRYDSLTAKIRKQHPTCTDFDDNDYCKLCGARKQPAYATPEGVGLIKSNEGNGDPHESTEEQVTPLICPLDELSPNGNCRATPMKCPGFKNEGCPEALDEKIMLPDEEEEE